MAKGAAVPRTLGPGAGREKIMSGIAGQLPRGIQRRMIDVAKEDRQAERDEEAARVQLHEEAYNRALALAIATAEASGEYPSPMELATVRRPADDQERDKRTQDAIQHVLDVQRAQYQRERDWEKEHPPPPAGPPERLHVFVDDPVLLAPEARSETGRKIFNRARHFQDLLDARRKLAAAEKAAAASRNDYGLVDGVTFRRRSEPAAVLTAGSERAGGPVRGDSGLRVRYGGPIVGIR